MSLIVSYPDGIYALDAGYIRPGLVAIHLIVRAGRVVIVDTGTAHSVPQVLAFLADHRLTVAAVDFILVTHVHLDHAGGAGCLMAVCPHAQLVLHPRGIRHMIDPARLMAGTIAVYGEAAFHRLYGEIVPVAAARIIEAADGFTLDWAGTTLRFLDTPGHAKHHYCVHDVQSNTLFTGDCFGVSYREFDCDGRAFILPTTTPVQFDPVAAHATLDRLMCLSPTAIFLTHWGRIDTDLPRLAADLHELLDAFVACAQATANLGAEAHVHLKTALGDLLWARLDAHGWGGTRAAALEILEVDLELSTQGLLIWQAGVS
jgi:glyoxylase-like metal-dependent hydrolase (beta-lactamase superfamily II)